MCQLKVPISVHINYIQCTANFFFFSVKDRDVCKLCTGWYFYSTLFLHFLITRELWTSKPNSQLCIFFLLTSIKIIYESNQWTVKSRKGQCVLKSSQSECIKVKHKKMLQSYQIAMLNCSTRLIHARCYIWHNVLLTVL